MSVSYATFDGTAKVIEDYFPASGTLSWGPNETGTKEITIGTADDNIPEPGEYFSVSLSNPVNASIGSGTASVNINDNDNP